MKSLPSEPFLDATLEKAGYRAPSPSEAVAPVLDPGAGGTALLLTADEDGSPLVRDLLAEARKEPDVLEPVASSANVAAAFREEQLALQKQAAEQDALRDSALALVGHLKGTTGLTVRREPDEGGSPRFTLLAVRVDAAGLASAEVLVSVAPWHHLEDAIERFQRTHLTPKEYR